MHRFLPVILFMVVTVLVSSCASSPSPVLPPVKLQDIKADFFVDESWFIQVGEGVSDSYSLLQPVFYKGAIYTVDYNGRLSVVNPLSGDVQWSKQLAYSVSAGLTRVENMLLLVTTNGEVVAIDIRTAKEIWKTQVSSEVFSRPIRAKGLVIVKSVDGKITALDLKTGNSKWIYDRPTPALTLRGNSRPVVYEDTIIAGLDNGKLVGLSNDTGQVIWNLTVAEPKGRTEIERLIDIDATPVINGEYLYVVAYQGKIASIHIPSGKLVWTRDFSSYSDISFDSSRILISDSDSNVWALDKKTGATLWKQDKLQRRAVTAPVIYKNSVIVGDFNGFVHWLNIDDGHIEARFRIGEGGDSIETADDFLYHKAKNILFAPLIINDIIFVFDRYGHISRLTIRK